MPESCKYKRLRVPYKDDIILVRPEDIIYIQSIRNHCLIYRKGHPSKLTKFISIQKIEFMARLTKHGISGKVGDIVYYIKNGKQLIRKAPGKRGKNARRPSEMAQMLKFKKSAIYANMVQSNPELYKLYDAAKKRNQTAYNLALRDARISPQVLMIDASRYIGNPGDEILIEACDDFKVTSVKVIIMDQTGEIIEEGEAILPFNSFDWQYTATKLNIDTKDCKIVAIAQDLPGNKGTMEITL